VHYFGVLFFFASVAKVCRFTTHLISPLLLKSSTLEGGYNIKKEIGKDF
jgi:hypothetical protein